MYIRMKGSSESDYCFEVTDDTTFNDLFDIFTKIPVVFSPSIFYDKIPTGFYVSTFPGVLTRTGGILYPQAADGSKYLKSIPHSQLSDKLSNHVLPGQLIIPYFKPRDFLNYSVIAFFAAWLYTDLPEFINPTPGYCLTYKITDWVVFLLNYFNLPDRAEYFYNEIHDEVSIVGQIIYFVFHIFKISLLYFILWAGLFNPPTFSPFASKVVLSEVLTKEDLLKLGWTGAKKAPLSKYQDEYRKN